MAEVIRLRFVQYEGVISDAIAAVQRDGWATHVEAVTAQGTWIGAQSPDGVKDRAAGYDSGSTILRQQIVELHDATPAQAEAFYAFMHSQVGKPYSYMGCASLTLGLRQWDAGKAWFCSELVAAALDYAGYWRLPTETNHVSPRDAYMLVIARRKGLPK